MPINIVNPTDTGKCVFCGGELKQKTVTFAHQVGKRCLLVEDVPAEVCAQCGEETYAPDVADELLKFAGEEFQPLRTVQMFKFRAKAQSSE